jgi:sulfate transport system ATP-binding protein
MAGAVRCHGGGGTCGGAAGTGHDEVHTTSLFVTHDQEEAFAVADRVMILAAGRLEQADTPEGILDRPATEFVARFVGDVNVLEGTAAGGVARVGGLSVPADVEGPVHVVVRAYDLKLWRAEAGGVATVRRVLPLGDRVRVEAQLDDGQALHAQFPRRSSLLTGVEPGCRVEVQITSSRTFSARS